MGQSFGNTISVWRIWGRCRWDLTNSEFAKTTILNKNPRLTEEIGTDGDSLFLIFQKPFSTFYRQSG